jgi:hypothetical protein
MLVDAGALSGSGKMHLRLAIAAAATGGSFTGTPISLRWRYRCSNAQGQ